MDDSAQPAAREPRPADSEHFWGATRHDAAYWADYLEARPQYDAAHYASVFDYHAAHGGPTPSWAVAHDLGTGPGQVAEVLATRFSHVIATDNNVKHLAEARHRLGQTVGLLQRVELAQVAAEDLGDRYPPGEADMVVAAECMPLIDERRAVPGWTRLLRPGGTLAVWFYGRLAFADPAVSERCTPLLADILDACFGRAIRASGPAGRVGWKRSTVRLLSWLDDVDFPEADFEHVQRFKWNTDKILNMYGEGAHDLGAQYLSNVHRGEKVVESEDRGKWAKDMDFEGVKQFVFALLPHMSQFVGDEHIQRNFELLEKAMGGKGVKQKICWPVVLLLATRK